MTDSLLYKLNSGKPNKAFYFIKKFIELLIPDWYYRYRLKSVLENAKKRSDYKEIEERVNYYIQLKENWQISSKDYLKHERSVLYYTGTLGGYKKKMFHTAYYFDQHDIMKWFPKKLRWNFCPGDVYFTPQTPSIVKSRLLTNDNQNSVVLKLDKLRHFMFINDPINFKNKKNEVIFRGKIRQSRVRESFIKKFFKNPLFDCGVVGRNEGCSEEWMKPKKTIREHLNYKFIMALEGNDVASNLKWVMSSNSIAVMTKPTCETWFMEGKLIADYHYIEVKEDFSDLEEKIKYYIDNPEKAQNIINNAHTFINQFHDKKREEIISLLVMKRYFESSNQMNKS